MRRTFVLLLIPALLFAACSSDDDDGAESTTTVAEAGGTITTEPTVPALSADEIDDSTPYCAAWKEIRSQGGAQTRGLSAEEAAARRREYYGRMVPLAERLLAVAPAEIEDEVQLALDNAREAARTGSFDPFRTEDSKEGARVLAQYALDHCRKKG